MKETQKARQFRFSMLVLASVLVAGGTQADSTGTVPFSVDNSAVNRLIIQAYEQNAEAWEPGQLFLVGICYVAEKRLDEAQTIFQALADDDPDQARTWRALGNMHHMKSEYSKAEECYGRAWSIGTDVAALAMLSVLKLRTNDLAGLKQLVPDLLAHQREDENIPKVLLSYCLMVEDKNEGGPIAADVVRALSPETIEQNKDLRELLIMATLRYTEEDSEENNETKDQSQDDPGTSP